MSALAKYRWSKTSKKKRREHALKMVEARKARKQAEKSGDK